MVDYSKTENAPQEADKFFRVFSRFEFALKEAGLFTEKEYAEANWNKFINRLPKNYWEKFNESAQTLIQTPPKKQVQSDGGLEWEACEAISSNDQLLGALKRVRNNLFHGGKSGNPDHDRNDALISEALLVLDDLLVQDETLRAYFEGRY